LTGTLDKLPIIQVMCRYDTKPKLRLDFQVKISTMAGQGSLLKSLIYALLKNTRPKKSGHASIRTDPAYFH